MESTFTNMGIPDKELNIFVLKYYQGENISFKPPEQFSKTC